MPSLYCIHNIVSMKPLQVCSTALVRWKLNGSENPRHHNDYRDNLENLFLQKFASRKSVELIQRREKHQAIN